MPQKTSLLSNNNLNLNLKVLNPNLQAIVILMMRSNHKDLCNNVDKSNGDMRLVLILILSVEPGSTQMVQKELKQIKLSLIRINSKLWICQKIIIKDLIKDLLSLKDIDNIWLKLEELKKLILISKGSTLILMVSLGTITMTELGKNLMIEHYLETSSKMMRLLLINLPKMFYKNMQPKE